MHLRLAVAICHDAENSALIDGPSRNGARGAEQRNSGDLGIISLCFEASRTIMISHFIETSSNFYQSQDT